MKNLFLISCLVSLFAIIGCKKTTCNAIRYDFYTTVQFTNGNDTFVFHLTEVPNNPISPPLVSTLDTINKIKQNGNRIINQTANVYKFLDCDECSKILQYNPGNQCIENK